MLAPKAPVIDLGGILFWILAMFIVGVVICACRGLPPRPVRKLRPGRGVRGPRVTMTDTHLPERPAREQEAWDGHGTPD